MSDASGSDPTAGIVHHVGHVDGLRLVLGICLCYVLCFAGLRVFIRWRNFGWDDVLVFLSTLLAMAFFGCGFAAAHDGVGFPMDQLPGGEPSMAAKQNHALMAGNITWITALCLSKSAVASTLMRTTQTAAHRIVQYAGLGVIALQCIASIALFAASCNTGDNLIWDFPRNTQTCPKQAARWRAITGLDVLTELVCLALPIHLTWSLQMSFKTKSIVVIAFWLRLPTLAFTVLRDASTQKLTSTTDALLASAMVIIWQCIELSFSLAAITVAALKSFTETLNTGFGHGELVRVHGASQTYQLSDLSGKTKTARTKSSTTTKVSLDEEASMPGAGLKLRPEFLKNSATITSAGNNGSAVGRGRGGRLIRSEEWDSSEDERIILQEVQYTVQYDEASAHSRGS